ncbi:MAG TPA: YIP1 family protein [Blastocatellia bacterium]|nr:YIP1 family protein [Blastocatellia bacterium]
MTPETTATPEPAGGNVFSQLIGVYFSPGEAFKDIGRKSPLLLPMILLALIVCAGVAITLNRIDLNAMMHKQIDPMVERGWIPQDRAEEMIKQTVANPTSVLIRGAGQAAVMTLLMTLVMAGVFKLISMLMGAENTFKPILSVTVFSYLAIALVTMVITTIVVYLQSPEEIDMSNPVGSNLAAVLGLFTDKASLPGFVKAFASFIDIFSIWRIALLSIGYAAISKKIKTGTVAMWLGVIYLLFALVMSPLIAMFMQ